jgi:hypothetical protein
MKGPGYLITAIFFFFSLHYCHPQAVPRCTSGDFENSITGNNFRLNTSRLKPPEVSPVIPVVIGLISLFYVINPIIQYGDKKISAGLTKEFSVGFGSFGEHRAAIEYSYIFRSVVRNSLKLSYKYDILLKDIEPSNTLQTSGVVSIGAGYFTNFEDKGFFPEISYGYSIRNHKLLIYPHIKFRQIFVLDKEKTNITDLSFGVMFGIANPFIDVKIRRK